MIAGGARKTSPHAKPQMPKPTSRITFPLIIGLVGCDADQPPSLDAALSPTQSAMDARAEEGTEPDASSLARDAGAYLFPCLGAVLPSKSDTFESVYLEVMCKSGCVDSYCHGSRGAWGGLDLASSIEAAYGALVDQPAGTLEPVDPRPTCRGNALLRVEPFAPERSILFLKLSGQPPCGSRMPPLDSGRPALGEEAVEHVRRWILAGAPLTEPRGFARERDSLQR